MLVNYGRPVEQDRPLYFHAVVSLIFFLSFFPRLISAVGDWMFTITSTHGVALEYGTIKSRSSLLAPAHPGGPGKMAVKRLWWWWCGLRADLECRSEMK